MPAFRFKIEAVIVETYEDDESELGERVGILIDPSVENIEIG